MVYTGPKGFSCTGCIGISFRAVKLFYDGPERLFVYRMHRDFFQSCEIVYDGPWRLFLSYGIQGLYCIAQRPVYMGPKGFSISDESRLPFTFKLIMTNLML